MGSFEPNRFSDQLSIDTPEQVDLRFNIAGIGSRFVALLLDSLLMLAFYIAEILILVAVSAAARVRGPASSNPTVQNWGIAILIFLNFCVFWGYFTLFEAYWRGQTPGKRVMKLRVLKDSGRQITVFEALARNLLRVVDYFPSLYLAGVITMMCNKRHKRLGDLAAGTIVVHEQPAEQPLFAQTATLFSRPARPWEPDASTGAALFPADAIARLRPQDLAVIEAFFARALDLSLDTRATMADRIARQMSTKMNAPLPEGNPERALESIASAMRGGRLP